jgi:hypothetical protein
METIHGHGRPRELISIALADRGGSTWIRVTRALVDLGTQRLENSRFGEFVCGYIETDAARLLSIKS